jgi:hypothetical protein
MLDADGEYIAHALRLLAPDTEHEEEVKALAASAKDGRDLWESLAARDIVPDSWLADGRRDFLPTSSVAGKRWLVDNESVMAAACEPVPLAVSDAATLALDARGVTTAEALAREIVAGLAFWRVPQPVRIRWWIVEESDASTKDEYGRPLGRPMVGITPMAPLRRAYYSLAVAEQPRSRRAPQIRRELVSRQTMLSRCRWQLAVALAEDLEASWQWQIASEDGWRYNKVPFSQLSCPFWAILALWKTGYVLVDLTADAIYLGARRR